MDSSFSIPPQLRASSTSKYRSTDYSFTPSPKFRKWIHPFLRLILFFTVFFTQSYSAGMSYADQCGSIVPEAIPSDISDNSAGSFRLSNGYFVGGDRLLDQDPGIDFSIPRFFSFYSRSAMQTEKQGTLKIAGTLIFRGGRILFNHQNITARGRLLRLVRTWNPQSFNERGRIRFDLSGFWSEESGKLCMVGTSNGRSKDGSFVNVSAVFKLKYPSSANISYSVVSGTLDSLESADSSNYFDRITVMAYAQRKYEYTDVFKSQSSCLHLSDSMDLSIDFPNRMQSICKAPRDLRTPRLKLKYKNSCSNTSCGHLFNSFGFQPAFLKFTSLDCTDDGRFRSVISFSNYTLLSSALMLEPEKTLVAEGSWDQSKNHLCLTACRVKKITDALADTAVDDCTISISLAFPAFFTIESRSSIVGRIWSNLNDTDSEYFNSVSFKGLGYNLENVASLRYKYTKMDKVRSLCTESYAHKFGKKSSYPDPRNFRDFRFDLLITTSEGGMGSGFANPLAIGETIYVYSLMEHPEFATYNKSIWNISYSLSYTYHQNSFSSSPDTTDISAEGIYNTKSGMICMVGCLSSSFDKQGRNLDSKDCNILINIQIPPLNPRPGELLKGTIRSTRTKFDPLFFKPIELSSQVMYSGQAAQLFWRMDLEITMILISLTLSCIFVGLQLLHAKKHPAALSSISITMLFFLTLGHMVVLVLNFEAFLKNHKKWSVLQENDGLLELNEVVVRLMTMVAFLLHFRLLQVALSSRSLNEGKNILWIAERKAIKICLLIYIAGGLVTWFVHLRSQRSLHQVPHMTAQSHHSRWEDVHMYAGLILDVFLVPQIIINALCDSKEASLTPPFYIGTTFLRALPHVYDAYRSSHYIPHLNSAYIYAKQQGDLYTLAWDIIIPCVGVLFAIAIYIQQRFGGASVLCRKSERTRLYEMVPVASS